MIDKKIKYAVQGGGPNYLGKQKMVKAPKKWKSSPDHPDTELAYITEPEKQVLIALNLHGGLEDGKPNRGPSGIISLQGDMGSIGGGGKSGGGNGEGRARELARQPRYTAPAPKPAPTPTRAPDFVTRPASVSPVSPVSYRDPDPVTEVVPGDVTPKKTYTPPPRNIHKDTGKEEEPYEMVGDVKVPLSMRGVKGVDPREDLERYFEKPGRDPFLVPEGERTIEDKEKIEDFERAQDYDLIDEMRRKGYDFKEIQSAIDKGLTVKAPTTDTSRQGLIDYGLSTLKNFIPETGLEKSLLSRLKSFAPGAKTGISSLADKMGGLGQYFNPGKMLTSFALNKMGLSFLNPILGIASLFGFNPFKNLGTGYSGIPTKNQPTMGGRGGDAENVVQASIQKFQPTQSQQDQMTEIMRKRMILQGYADKGALNERGQDTLTQMNNLISQYQADPRSIYG